MKLQYKKYGEGTPLVILHGLLGAGGNWHTLARKDFSKRAAVFAVDLRNHGQSPHDPVMNYPAMSDDVRQFIVDHELGRIDLLGHSMGGKVAMQFATDHSELVNKLVVVDVAPRGYEDRHGYIVDALRSLDLSAYQTREGIDTALAARIPSMAVRQFLLKNLRYSPEEGYSWLVNLDAINASYDDISGPLRMDKVFRRPALFVRGGQSDYLLPSDEEMIRRNFPSARFVTIQNAGHWVHADAPDVFAAMITDFLTDDE